MKKQRNGMTKVVSAFLCVMLIAVAMFAGCAPAAEVEEAAPVTEEAEVVAEATEETEVKKDLKVVMVPKFTGFAYFQASKVGGELACEDLGISDFSYVGTTTADIEGQAQVLQNLIPQKPDVVVAAILDKDALLPALTKLREQGTIVITYDDPAGEGGQDLYCNMASYKAQAQAMLENALTCNPDGRKLIWVAPSATNASFIGKKEALDWCIANVDRYKDFEFIDTLYTDDDPEKGYSMALSAMQAYPELSGFVSGSGMTNPAMNKAIADSGNIGKVYCTGSGIPDTMREYAENGVCAEFSLWDPTMLGYMATYIGVQYARGELELEEGLVLDIPRVGEREILSADGSLTCNLDAMMFFDKDHTTFETGLPMADVLAERGVELVK